MDCRLLEELRVSYEKTRLEKWFSLSRHQRRVGAKELSALIFSDIFGTKKHNDEVVHTHGGSKKIDGHFDALGQVFAEQGEPRPSLEAKADQNTRLT